MYVKFDFNTLCRKVLEDKLQEHGLKYRILNFGEVELYESFTKGRHSSFRKNLEDYGIEIVENQKTVLVQKIKDVIAGMVFYDDLIPVKASVYIAEKLHHSYGYLSSLFSENARIPIENFIIIQKVEYAKELIGAGQHTFTEIAHRLNYSSVAHLSAQLKK